MQHLDDRFLDQLYQWLGDWLVVWNIFYVSIYWEYLSQLTNIFQRVETTNKVTFKPGERGLIKRSPMMKDLRHEELTHMDHPLLKHVFGHDLHSICKRERDDNTLEVRVIAYACPISIPTHMLNPPSSIDLTPWRPEVPKGVSQFDTDQWNQTTLAYPTRTQSRTDVPRPRDSRRLSPNPGVHPWMTIRFSKWWTRLSFPWFSLGFPWFSWVFHRFPECSPSWCIPRNGAGRFATVMFPDAPCKYYIPTFTPKKWPYHVAEYSRSWASGSLTSIGWWLGGEFLRPKDRHLRWALLFTKPSVNGDFTNKKNGIEWDL